VARGLKGLNGKRVLRALERAGFEIVRVIVPVHGAHDLPPGTVRSIIEQSGLTAEEFVSLL
jgi:predicted RNA binding protein YcfA (HicA-like mRNA interferase family)